MKKRSFAPNEQTYTILLNGIAAGIASTVTDAFIDANGQKLSNKKLKDLPKVGDEMDLKSTVGGHFHGFFVSKAIVASKWLKNSKGEMTSEMKNFIDKKYLPWEYNQPILTIEGTGNIDPYILPTKETFENDKEELSKRLYQRDLFKFIRSHKSEEDDEKGGQSLSLENHNPEELKIFNEILTPMAQPFYSDKQEKDRRISRFYKDMVHFMDEEIYEMDSTFSQLIFCYKDKNSFGVNIGDILRDIGNKPSNIMLLRPLSSGKREERELWNYGIKPFMKTLESQQPISIIGNYNKEEYSKLISQRIFKNEEESSSSTQMNMNNYMNIKGEEKTIYITNIPKAYIINNQKNPILDIKQGKHYILNINAKGHPFYILDKLTNKPLKSDFIENNGTDFGELHLFIPPTEKYVPSLIYRCGIHPEMTGPIAIIQNKLVLSSKETLPDIKYQFKKPKWHFDTDFENIVTSPNYTIMQWYTKQFYFNEHKDLDIKLKNEIEYLKEKKGVIDYAIYEEKYFPQTDSIISVLLIIDVNYK